MGTVHSSSPVAGLIPWCLLSELTCFPATVLVKESHLIDMMGASFGTVEGICDCGEGEESTARGHLYKYQEPKGPL
jgi:hypothetical protein